MGNGSFSNFFYRHDANQILSYYGNPYVAAMGILGELDPHELVARVKAHARKYDELNGFRGVRPALHLVYATAQKDPGREGTYLLYVDEKTLKEYIDLACQNGLFIFLDLQIGRSSVEASGQDAYRGSRGSACPSGVRQPGQSLWSGRAGP